MKRWIHASTNDFYSNGEALEALERIFSNYGLLVDYYRGTDQYMIYPEGWYWPYNYCRGIKFGETKTNGNDILVPVSYLDGINTTLPQSAIDKAVKAASRAQAKIDEQKYTYPAKWPKGYMSGEFISKLADYLQDDMESIDDSHGLKFEMSSMLPTPTSEVYYDDITTGDHEATITYKQWLKDMHGIVTEASSRDQFKQYYSEYLDSLE